MLNQRIPQIFTLSPFYVFKVHGYIEKAPKELSFRAFLYSFRWTTKIRTWTNRTKTCCAAITP